MPREPGTTQERVRRLLRATLATSKWLPTTEEQRLVWAIRLAVLLGVLLTISYAFDKTLWDWLKLLIVPAVIAVGAAWFNKQQRERELTISERSTQEEVLRTYLSQMADLILHEDLLERVKRAPRPEVRELLEELDRQQEVVQKKLNRLLGEPPEQFLQREPQEVRERLLELEQGEPQQVQELVQLSAQLKERRDEELQRLMIEMEEPMMMATAFTRTTLGRVDGSRKGKIIDFLHETNMINRAMTVVVLQRADISHADVSNLNLAGDDLSGANLSHANLTGADLTGANLRAADLTRTQLGTARLTLVHGDEETEPAPPNPAVLNRANLSYADLSYARGWTYEQLDRAESLDDAAMPDGRSYAYWVEKGWLRTRSDRDARGRGRESSST